MRILVARMDGTPESGFERGAIGRQRGVPVTRNFDPREPPLGLCDIEVDGDSVYAVIDDAVAERAVGLYPAVGVRADHAIGFYRAQTCRPTEEMYGVTVFEVSLCDHPNTDPQIPPIS